MAGRLTSFIRFSSIRRLLATRIGMWLFAASFLLLWASVFFVSRSFLVQAETAYAELTFAGEVNAWQFPDATVCRAREIPVPSFGDERSGPCSLVLFDYPDAIAAGSQPGGGAESNEVTIDWACGARAVVEADLNGDLVITLASTEAVEALDQPCRANAAPARLLPDGEELQEGTTIIVPASAWRQTGALPFYAEATLGDDLGPGSVHYLQSGRWEARQTSPVFRLLRLHTVTEVVKEGELFIGAEATIYEHGHPAVMSGHITPTPLDFDHSLAGFDVVMLSAPGRTELRLAHFGFAEPTRIRPDWVDTAITSPMFLAIFAILNLLAVIVQIYADGPTVVRRRGGGVDKPARDGAAGED